MRESLRCLAVALCALAASLPATADSQSTPTHSSEPAVTPVAGQSWINHLNRPFGDTSMGKTGRLGPPPPDSADAIAAQPPLLLPSLAGGNVSLRGADLYRLNCQGCHGEAGLGAPPEIHSVIDPVRATSVPLVVARMKKSGMEITSAAAGELAKQAQDALLQRLHQGGESMPPFPHLTDGEIHALIAYLKQLSGVPGAAQMTVTESQLRVGEHIVKSTCHTCHDAAGPNPTASELENGAIPPLETLTLRTDEMGLIRKVTLGAPIVMGTPPAPHRGRMPVFYYLTQQEAADVYLYLATNPPSQLAAAVPMSATASASGSSGEPTNPSPPAPQIPAATNRPQLWRHRATSLPGS